MRMFAKNIAIYLFTGLIANTYLYAGGNSTYTPRSTVVAVPDVSSENGFYVGIGTGKMRLKDDFTKEYFETYPLLLQLGYQFDKYLAIEGRYVRDMGRVKYENGITLSPDMADFPTTFSNQAIYLKPMYPMGNYSLYALLGYGKVSLSNIRGANRAESAFQWGAGISYNISNHMKVFVDYSRLYSGDGFDGRAKQRNVHVDLIAVGASYVF